MVPGSMGERLVCISLHSIGSFDSNCGTSRIIKNFLPGAYPVPDSMKKEYEYADEGATAAS